MSIFLEIINQLKDYGLQYDHELLRRSKLSLLYKAKEYIEWEIEKIQLKEILKDGINQ